MVQTTLFPAEGDRVQCMAQAKSAVAVSVEEASQSRQAGQATAMERQLKQVLSTKKHMEEKIVQMEHEKRGHREVLAGMQSHLEERERDVQRRESMVMSQLQQVQAQRGDMKAFMRDKVQSMLQQQAQEQQQVRRQHAQQLLEMQQAFRSKEEGIRQEHAQQQEELMQLLRQQEQVQSELQSESHNAQKVMEEEVGVYLMGL